MEGISCQSVIVRDDISIENEQDRRGVAGTVLVHKYAGYLSDNGYNLATIKEKVESFIENKILKLQKTISNSINKALVGTSISCIVEQIREDGLVVLRSYKDAPDVDGLVYAKTDKVLVPGDIWDVKITDFSDYDLFGEI